MFWFLAGAALTVPSLALGAFYSFQDRLVYMPGFPEGSVGKLICTPADIGIEFEDLSIRTRDNVSLHGWLASDPQATHTVIYFHGNAGNLSHRIDVLHGYRNRLRSAVNVLFVDYRGYGLSQGVPTEEGLMMDADAVIGFFIGRSDLRKTHLIIHGQSLGGAVATYAATTHAAAVQTLILENTFTSIEDMVEKVHRHLKYVKSLATNKWRSLERIQSMRPSDRHRFRVLFLAGSADQMVPHDQMLKLYAACPMLEPQKQLVVFPGAPHDGMHDMNGYWRAIDEFLRQR